MTEVKRIFVFGYNEFYERSIADVIIGINEKVEVKTAYQMDLRGKGSEIPKNFHAYIFGCSLLGDEWDRTQQLRKFKQDNPEKKFYLNNYLPKKTPKEKTDFFDREYEFLGVDAIKQILLDIRVAA